MRRHIFAAVITAFLTSCLVHAGDADSQLKSPVTSQDLFAFLQKAKKLAVTKLDGVAEADLVSGLIAPMYSSRTSGAPSGVIVSFTLRGSQTPTDGHATREKRVLVMIPDQPTKPDDVEVKIRDVWIDQALLGVTR
jgi:hypothetical protein